MPETRTDVVALHHTLGTLAKEIGAKPTRGAEAAGQNDLRVQLGQTLEALYVALNELRQGRPAPMYNVWSHREDVTYTPAGAAVAAGWDAVRSRIERDIDKPDGATLVADDVTITLCVDAAWAVCAERITPAKSAPPAPDLRQLSTNVFRREAGAWRLVHRQAATVA